MVKGHQKISSPRAEKPSNPQKNAYNRNQRRHSIPSKSTVSTVCDSLRKKFTFTPRRFNRIILALKNEGIKEIFFFVRILLYVERLESPKQWHFYIKLGKCWAIRLPAKTKNRWMRGIKKTRREKHRHQWKRLGSYHLDAHRVASHGEERRWLFITVKCCLTLADSPPCVPGFGAPLQAWLHAVFDSSHPLSIAANHFSFPRARMHTSCAVCFGA